MIFRYKAKFISDIEQKIRKLLVNIAVAPFVGVWIEIILRYNPTNSPLVDSFVRMQIQLYFTWCGLY